MTKSLGYSAVLALTLCATPLLAQQDAAPPQPAALSAVALSPQAAPGIRIVRLSQVVGTAQMDRGIDRGFESAFTNLPITQGAKLLTADGVAEVEFEDNSSMRLTPNTLVEFPILSLRPDGTRVSTVRVRGGTVYVSLAKDKSNTFNVLFGNETVALTPASHIELTISPTERRLDVLDGTAQATSGTTTTEVGKKKSLQFGAASAPSPLAPTLVSKVEKGGEYDAWDKQAVEYHSHYASASHYASTPYAYGLADMNYYGGFSDIGGCGSMWRPYLASANWSPYANGTWAWYSGAGYSFVSPYPWGWTAFHSGSWNYCSTGGWGWQPNGQWSGLNNVASATSPAPSARMPATGLHGPVLLKPPYPPQPVGPTTVPVHEGPLVASKFTAQDTFVFRNDSAGLGVPRGTFGKLNGISSNVGQHGAVERPVYFSSGSAGSQGPGSTGQRSAVSSEIGGRSLASARGTAISANSGSTFAGSRSVGASAMSSGSSMSSGGGHFGGMSGGVGGASVSAGSSGGHH